MREELDDPWQILGMGHVARAPALVFLQSLTEVVERLTVDEFDLTGGAEGGDQPWNAVDDQARLSLALAERVLGVLALVDVDQQDAPANDSASRITKRKPVVLEPAVRAIRSAEALQD